MDKPTHRLVRPVSVMGAVVPAGTLLHFGGKVDTFGRYSITIPFGVVFYVPDDHVELIDMPTLSEILSRGAMQGLSSSDRQVLFGAARDGLRFRALISIAFDPYGEFARVVEACIKASGKDPKTIDDVRAYLDRAIEQTGWSDE